MSIISKTAYLVVSILRKPMQLLITKRLGKCGKDVCVMLPCKLSKPQNVYMNDYSLIQPNVTFIINKGKVYIGKWTAIASNCTLITDNHIPTVGVNHRMLGRYHINDRVKDIILEDDCWVGAGVTLMNGAILRRGSIAAAGAVVNKTVPPYAVVAGIPAKIISSVFTLDQIIEHEKYLYPENERMKREELEDVFNKYYKDKKAIGLDISSDDVITEIQKHKEMQFAVYK